MRMTAQAMVMSDQPRSRRSLGSSRAVSAPDDAAIRDAEGRASAAPLSMVRDGTALPAGQGYELGSGC